jgi:hypothetical protein
MAQNRAQRTQMAAASTNAGVGIFSCNKAVKDLGRAL